MAMDQGEEAGPVQPDQRQGSQGFGVAAVELVGDQFDLLTALRFP